MRSYYLATLCVLTLAVGAYELWPFPRFGVVAAPARPDAPGYERELFQVWQPHGACTTREVPLAAQTILEDCKPVAEVYDPYANEMLPVGTAVEVDHIFPLSAAWDLGAHAWTPQRRREFANDPVNLVATQRRLNQAKSDSLPAEWLPPSNRCAYAHRLAKVARTYGLALPRQDLRVMRKQCRFAVGPGTS